MEPRSATQRKTRRCSWRSITGSMRSFPTTDDTLLVTIINHRSFRTFFKAQESKLIMKGSSLIAFRQQARSVTGPRGSFGKEHEKWLEPARSPRKECHQSPER